MRHQVTLFPGDDYPRKLRHFYNLLTDIATNVWQALGLQMHEAAPDDTHVPFHKWPRKYVKSICFSPPSMTIRYPIQTDSRTDEQAIKKYFIKTLKPLLRFPTPIQADVWWRILFRMLPVNYQFFFRQESNPGVMECSYPGCSAVETMQHVLFDCKYVKPVWSWHRTAWQQFGIPFTLDTIINLDKFQVSEDWVTHTSILCRLWALLVAGLLRDLWIHRNKTKFEGRPVPYLKVVKEVSLVSWSANVRRWLRDASTLEDERAEVLYFASSTNSSPTTTMRGFGENTPSLSRLSTGPLDFTDPSSAKHSSVVLSRPFTYLDV
ncbi:hypothetical protein AC1031_001535 [Aphanomyces cochlioides]|nr:hypothetical protein AC1031_001535 [Aphanomyces cochlioides]